MNMTEFRTKDNYRYSHSYNWHVAKSEEIVHKDKFESLTFNGVPNPCNFSDWLANME